ncbi:GGDEF domain-containing protein [Roseibium algae]|uniref:diguanylate cyclase n=1 Tax=Roseibium algae TaxID=3123038 RepID=A0ABU8TRC3_9HYPH
MHLFVHSVLMTLCTLAIAIEFWSGSAADDKFKRGSALLFTLVSVFHGLRGVIGLSEAFPGNILEGNNALALSFFAPLFLFLVGALMWLAIYWRGYVAELKNLAERDPLTNVFNRRSLIGLAEKLIKSRHAKGNATALLLFDLDHFKVVNDTHGHAAGDLVLRRFCDLITSELGSSDIFARLGGEEFVAMLAVNSSDDACSFAEKLRKIVSASTFELSGRSISVTVSVGVAVADGDYCSFASLMKNADGALYVAKRTGRNRVESCRSPSVDNLLNCKEELFAGGSVAA